MVAMNEVRVQYYISNELFFERRFTFFDDDPPRITRCNEFRWEGKRELTRVNVTV